LVDLEGIVLEEDMHWMEEDIVLNDTDLEDTDLEDIDLEGSDLEDIDLEGRTSRIKIQHTKA
jgi:uncharacterized protein YjbI with pentapeptide repeats